MDKYIIVTISLFIALSGNALLMAQSREFQIPNITYDSLTTHLYGYYSNEIDLASSINNGPEYYHDDVIIGGSPFWGLTQFHDGSVVLEGNRYDHQEIGYDVFRDELFISRYDDQRLLTKVKLPYEKVDGFILSDHPFVHLMEQELNENNHPGQGYYEVLYSGNLKVISRRKKKIVPSSDGLYRYKFESIDKIIVFKDEFFHLIRSKRTIKKLLSDEKRAIRAFVKENRQDLKELEDYVVGVSRYYDSIISDRIK